jgi:hypothetical protein
MAGSGPAGRPVVVAVIAILDPLPDVAMHVVKTPRVRLEAAHGYGRLSILALRASTLIDVVAIIVGLGRGNRRTPPEWRGRSGAGRILPFRLTEQAVAVPGGLR